MAVGEGKKRSRAYVFAIIFHGLQAILLTTKVANAELFKWKCMTLHSGDVNVFLPGSPRYVINFSQHRHPQLTHPRIKKREQKKIDTSNNLWIVNHQHRTASIVIMAMMAAPAREIFKFYKWNFPSCLIYIRQQSHTHCVQSGLNCWTSKKVH